MVNGAGAAAIACTALIKAMGMPHDHVLMCDRSGVIYVGRDNVDQWKSAHAVETAATSLEEALEGAEAEGGLEALSEALSSAVRSANSWPNGDGFSI